MGKLINISCIKRNYQSLFHKNQRIIIKLKASTEIGLGHLSRMITLASFLKESRKSVLFAINNFDYAKNKLKSERFDFEINQFGNDEKFIDYLIEKYNPDSIVIDEKKCYPKNYLEKWQERVKTIIVDHICDDYGIVDKIVIPNAHFYPERFKDFDNIVYGWNWVLINKEILKLKPKERLPEKINKIVVTTGGTDPKGILFEILDKIKNTEKEVLILVGDSFKHKDRLENLNLPKNFKIERYQPIKLLEGDVAIATFGVSVYELIYLNVPVYCIGHTKENKEGCKTLAERCKIMREFLRWNEEI